MGQLGCKTYQTKLQDDLVLVEGGDTHYWTVRQSISQSISWVQYLVESSLHLVFARARIPDAGFNVDFGWQYLHATSPAEVPCHGCPAERFRVLSYHMHVNRYIQTIQGIPSQTTKPRPVTVEKKGSNVH